MNKFLLIFIVLTLLHIIHAVNEKKQDQKEGSSKNGEKEVKQRNLSVESLLKGNKVPIKDPDSLSDSSSYEDLSSSEEKISKRFSKSRQTKTKPKKKAAKKSAKKTGKKKHNKRHD
ncbi:CLUMA_CG007356, isoform A [Clunio marinus]|uniref:CLUMA_CG007356, isoform A n=1 Tax=Clunio marinus TaxID=568069 RepID=A0A1J1I0N0_9DIPT|nr:CLUMA_CG007356, isoform A [Clunio marinus]